MAFQRALILGSGYTGAFIKSMAPADSAEVLTTNRRGGADFKFDLLDPETWAGLPKVDLCFWTFPAEPVDLVESFLKAEGSKLGRIVAIGTTSSYKIADGTELVETSPLEASEGRVQGELALLKRGGIVVRAAGIYGPARDPRSWVERGLVGSSDKLVNFIHVRDLSRILWAAALRGQPGVSYLASDGRPFAWANLIAQMVQEFGTRPAASAAPSRRTSKSVNPSWTLQELQVDLEFRSVIDGLKDFHS